MIEGGWPSAGQAAGQVAARAGLEAAAEMASRQGKSRRRAYFEVLEGLAADGDMEGAVERLARVEIAIFDQAQGTAPLSRLEVDAAARLAAREPEAVIPVLALHSHAYAHYYRLEHFSLAGHSERVVRQVAERLTRKQLSEESLPLVAELLTSLAELAERNGMFMRGQQLLKQAVELDSENQPALRMLAINYEKLGRYVEARRLLSALTRLDSTHQEARLRLAIMDLRLGDTAAAEHRLSALLREQVTPWVLSLAYQALAQILGADDRFSEATETLAVARRRLPEDQRIQLLLAYTHDRAGDPGKAVRLLDRLPIDPRSRTPRFRYAEPADERLEQLRDRLDQGVNVRLSVLAGVLMQVMPAERAR